MNYLMINIKYYSTYVLRGVKMPIDDKYIPFDRIMRRRRRRYYRESAERTENDTLDRLNWICWFVNKIAIVLQIAVVVVIIAIFIGMGLSIVFQDTLLSLLGSDFALGQLLTQCITGICVGVIALLVLHHVGRLSMNIYKNNTPFTKENVLHLEMIAIVTIIGAFAVPIASTISAYALDAPGAAYPFNILLLFTGLLVYFMSLIFRYGTALQKESDETL